MRSSPEAMSIIKAASQLVSKSNRVNWMEWMKGRSVATSLFVPRIPHTLLLAIGGWVNSTACDLLEVYDNRGDRWIRVDQCDNALGRRAYHRAAVIGNKIYCIGGYCNSEYFNKCAVFDLIKKEWKEVTRNGFINIIIIKRTN